MVDKKDAELKCYQYTKDFISTKVNIKIRKYINSIFPITDDYMLLTSERPDFVVNRDSISYAIEHFMVDFCNDGIDNNQSKSKLANREVGGIFKKYHDASIGTIKDSDMEAAIADIESQVNRISNIALSFDYKKYVEAFTRIFNHHYKNIITYKSNPELSNKNARVGFLIELHCDTNLVHALLNGSVVSFDTARKSFPLTKEIATLLQNATELDFVIVSQFNEGVYIEASDAKIYVPNDMETSLKKQRVTVYDEIIYPDIRRNVTLNLKKTVNGNE